MDFVNKIKSTDAIYLKLPYVCSQFNMNYRRKFQTNHLKNVVIMTICSMGVSASRTTLRRKRHLTPGFLYTLAES